VLEVEQMDEDLGEIKARADRLRRVATYRGAEDTVPAPDSIPATDGGGLARRSAANVLLDEYWDIQRALVR
jgi:hypothetical protein